MVLMAQYVRRWAPCSMRKMKMKSNSNNDYSNPNPHKSSSMRRKLAALLLLPCGPFRTRSGVSAAARARV
jgi:hypothetical protein